MALTTLSCLKGIEGGTRDRVKFLSVCRKSGFSLLVRSFLQAPLFFFSGAQLHSLRARVNFALQMGRNV
jgi:hypothetical protein